MAPEVKNFDLRHSYTGVKTEKPLRKVKPSSACIQMSPSTRAVRVDIGDSGPCTAELASFSFSRPKPSKSASSLISISETSLSSSLPRPQTQPPSPSIPPFLEPTLSSHGHSYNIQREGIPLPSPPEPLPKSCGLRLRPQGISSSLGHSRGHYLLMAPREGLWD